MKLNSDIIQGCGDEELKKVLLKLQTLNDYYSLFDASSTTYAKTLDVLGEMPVQLKEWLKLFDGGHLFFTIMLTSGDSTDIPSNYPTFAEVNSLEYKRNNNISKEAACFAIASDGDLYCFDSEEKSQKIYEWDCREGCAVDEWDNFAAWLLYRIEFACDEIADGTLTPMED